MLSDGRALMLSDGRALALSDGTALMFSDLTLDLPWLCEIDLVAYYQWAKVYLSWLFKNELVPHYPWAEVYLAKTSTTLRTDIWRGIAFLTQFVGDSCRYTVKRSSWWIRFESVFLVNIVCQLVLLLVIKSKEKMSPTVQFLMSDGTAIIVCKKYQQYFLCMHLHKKYKSNALVDYLCKNLSAKPSILIICYEILNLSIRLGGHGIR